MNATLANTKSVLEGKSASRVKKFASRIAVAALALLSLTVVPHSTEAQAAASGAFTLAAPAKLGTVTLPAGEYKYKVQWTGSLPLLTVSAVDGGVSEFIFAKAVKELSTPVPDKLTLSVANGETYISSLAISELGLKLYYGEPKTIVAKKYAVPGTALASNVQPAK